MGCPTCIEFVDFQQTHFERLLEWLTDSQEPTGAGSKKVHATTRKWYGSEKNVKCGQSGYVVGAKKGLSKTLIGKMEIDEAHLHARVIYRWKCKTHANWRYVGKAEDFYKRTAEHLTYAFSEETKSRNKERNLGPALRQTTAKDWKIKILRVVPDDEDLELAETKCILEQNTMYPNGLNFSLV